MINPSRWKVSPVSRDLLIAIALTVLAILIEWRFDLIDTPLAAIRQGHVKTVDEVLQITAIIGVALVGFVWRQWRMLQRENRERARAEHALRRSEEQYRALFAAAHEPMLIFRPADKIILAANERAAELYGIPRDGLVGRSLQAFSTDRERGSLSIQDLLWHADTTPRRTFSFVQRRPDGSRLDIVAQASVVTYDGETAILTINRDVTEQKRAEELLQRQNAYYVALHETSLGLLHQLDPTAVLEAIVERAAALAGTTHGYVELVTDDGEQLETVVSIGTFRADRGARKRRGEGLGGTICRTGQPLVVNDYEAWSGRLPDDDRATCHAVVGVPLMSGDTVVGVLGLTSLEKERTFGEEEVAFLTRFAALASIALHNARLHTAAQHELDERRRAEEQLRESEERYRRLFEQSPDAIAIITNRRYLSVNDAAVRLFGGQSPEDIVGRSVFDFVPEEEQEDAEQRIQGALAHADAPPLIEWRRRRLDGEIRMIESIGIPITYEGRPATHVVYRDVTERKAAEEILQRQNAYLTALHETSLGLMNRLDLTELLETILVHAGTLLGAPDGLIFWLQAGNVELPTRIGIGIFHNDSRSPTRRGEGLIGTVWETGERLVLNDYQCWPKRRVGDKRDQIHAAVAVPLFAGGQIIGVISLVHTQPEQIFSDDEIELLTRFAHLAAIALDNARLYTQMRQELGERERAEIRLRESEEHYRTLIESSPAPITVHSGERIVFANAAAVQLYRTASAAELVGRSVCDFVPPDFQTQAQQIMRVGYEERQPMGPVDVAIAQADGGLAEVELQSIPIMYEDQTATLTVLHDVTARKQAERQLRDSEERYRLMFDGNPRPMWVYDLETLAFLAVNDAAVAHYGYTRDEFLSMTIKDTRPPEDVPQLLDDLRKGMQRLEQGRRVRHRTKDGTIIDVEINSHDLDLDGSRTRLVLASDVTERVRAEDALRESEERYRTLIERSPEPIVVHDKERYVFANAAALKLLGAARPEQVIGKSVYSFIHPTFRAVARRRIRTSYAERATSGVTELTMLRVDGEAVEVETDNMPITYHDQPATLVIFHDITARKQAERRLRESEERYRLMFDSNPLPMWVYDDETLAFLAVNDAAINHYGYSRDAFLAMTTADIRLPEDIPALRAYLATYANTYQPSGIWRHRKKDGTLVDMDITSYLLQFEGRTARLVVANDVTERQRAEVALRHHALHDALTDLPNRTLFVERLARALERARRDPAYHYAVLYLDFDRFKTINDSLGHLEGDQMLIEGAHRLARCVRPQDTLARFGGDEFVILLEELADAGDPIETAQCLSQALAEPIALRGQEVVIMASIGIVFGTSDYHRPDEVLRDADIAMYQAKALGKGEPVVFDTTMHARAVARLHLENDLRRAVEHAEFTLFYQPIVTLTTGETVGFEALARWQHPEIGLIAPAEFIPLAEETGLIVPLGQWVLREACQQLRRWDKRCPTHAPLTVSVNVSARELRHPDFVAYVLSVVREAGLEPDRLVLEITESTLIEEAEAVTLALQALQSAGVRIQLDDFGMGYSSLSYLHRFPLDALKIDRSFVSAAGQSGIVNRAIVAAIVALAHTLRITVTAEGIETAEQQTALEALGCEYGQGHRFSPPVTAEVVVRLLQGETMPYGDDAAHGAHLPSPSIA